MPGAYDALEEGGLGIEIIRALDFDGRHGRFIGSVLAELCEDPAVIGYRQDLLNDLRHLLKLSNIG